MRRFDPADPGRAAGRRRTLDGTDDGSE